MFPSGDAGLCANILVETPAPLGHAPNRPMQTLASNKKGSQYRLLVWNQ
jgi:hypothetical protein